MYDVATKEWVALGSIKILTAELETGRVPVTTSGVAWAYCCVIAYTLAAAHSLPD